MCALCGARKTTAAKLAAEVDRLILKLGLDSDLPIESDSPYRMLSSDAIKTMAATGLIEFGAHTHYHPILTRLPRRQQIEEISRSIEAVQKITGRPCEYFAYPNGQPKDYDIDIIRVLKSHKIRAAVTGIPEPNDKTTPVMELRRYGIGYDATLAYFQLKVHHFIAHAQSAHLLHK